MGLGKDYDGYLMDSFKAWNAKALGYWRGRLEPSRIRRNQFHHPGPTSPRALRPRCQGCWRIRFAHRTFARSPKRQTMQRCSALSSDLTRTQAEGAALGVCDPEAKLAQQLRQDHASAKAGALVIRSL